MSQDQTGKPAPLSKDDLERLAEDERAAGVVDPQAAGQAATDEAETTDGAGAPKR